MKNVVRVRAVIIALAIGISGLVAAAQTDTTPPSSPRQSGAEETSKSASTAQIDAAVVIVFELCHPAVEADVADLRPAIVIRTARVLAVEGE